MNLYKILFSHHAPKDSESGIKTYLLANNANEIYDYIDKEYNYGCWKDSEECDKTFRERMMQICGNFYDEDYDFSNAYYGITLYGWELIETPSGTDFSNMINLGIVKVA